MKIIISERQYWALTEQQEIDYLTGPGTFYGTYGYDKEGKTIWNKTDPHIKNAVLGFLATFIPYIGLPIAAGIGFYDADLYNKEGDSKTASLVRFFSLLPFLGEIAPLVGIGTKIAPKALPEIGKKLAVGGKLAPAEVEFIETLTKNKTPIINAIKNKSSSLAKGAVKVTAPVAGAVTLGVAHNKAYDIMNPYDIQVQAEKEGLDWGFVMKSFGSSGKDDNTQLKKAWSVGWRPGKIVPNKFQTKKYQEEFKKESDNLAKLEKLIAQAKGKN